MALEHATFSDGVLIFSDEDRALVPDYVSASTMSSVTGDACQASWLTKRVYDEPYNPLAAYAVGNVIHTAFEHLFGLEADKRTRDAFDDLLRAACTHDGELNEAQYDDAREKSVRYFDIEDPTQIDVVATEFKFDGVEVAGVPILGFIDRIERNDKGKLVIKDYKTGKWQTPGDLTKYGDNYGEQLTLYAMAYEEATGEKIAEAHLLYTKVGRSRKVPLTKARKDAVIEKLVSARAEMDRMKDTGEAKISVTGLCGYCPLVNTCPAANKAGKYPADSYQAPTDITVIGGIGQMYDDDEFAPDEQAVEPHYLFHEDKPFAAMFPSGKETANAASYGAIGAFGFTSIAWEQLLKHNGGVTSDELYAYSTTLMTIVARTQKKLSGRTNFEDGLNTRLRGLLHALLPSDPLPLGGSDDDFIDWGKRVMGRLEAMATNAYEMMAFEPASNTPWRGTLDDTVMDPLN